MAATQDLYKFQKNIESGDAVETFEAGTLHTNYAGELMAWDYAGGTVIAMTTTGKMFLGAAETSHPVDRSGDASGAIGLRLVLAEDRVRIRGVWKFKTTASESYVHKTAVAMGADTQTVTTAIAGKQVVGYVWLPDGTTVTGASGTDVPVSLLGNKMPALWGRNFLTASIPANVAADVGTNRTFPIVANMAEDGQILSASISIAGNQVVGGGTAAVRITSAAGADAGTAFLSAYNVSAAAGNQSLAAATGTGAVGTYYAGANLLFVDVNAAGTRVGNMAVTIEFLPRN